MRPCCRMAASTRMFTWSGSLTSHGTISTSDVHFARSSCAASSSHWSRAHRTRLAPSLAKPRASANPRPRDPPVIRTTLPVRFRFWRFRQIAAATPKPMAAPKRAALRRIGAFIAQRSSTEMRARGTPKELFALWGGLQPPHISHLEVVLKSELQGSGAATTLALHAADDSRVGLIEVAIGQLEVRMIEDVKRLPS